MKQSHLQEGASFPVMAFQEVSLSLLRQETGNITWDSHVKTIQDRED